MSEFLLIDPAAITAILATIAALLTGTIVFLIAFSERPADARFGATHRSASCRRRSPTRIGRPTKHNKELGFQKPRGQR
jgi:hypothetical protein